jgi:thioredoxin 1
MVKLINKMEDISKDKKVVIDFFAPSCGPCKRIAPDYEKLAETYTNIEFVKCDVDDSSELAELFEIESLPTFLLINNLKVVHKFVGADMEGLTKKVDELNDLVGTPKLKKCVSKVACGCIEDCEKESCECKQD